MADTRPAGEGSERSGEPKVPAQDQPVSELARLIAESDAKGKGFWRRRKRKAASTAPVAVPAAVPAAEPAVEKVAEPTSEKTAAPAAVKTAEGTTGTAAVGADSPAAGKPAENPEAASAEATDAKAADAGATDAGATDAGAIGAESADAKATGAESAAAGASDAEPADAGATGAESADAGATGADSAEVIDADATAAAATGEATVAKVTDDEAAPGEGTPAEATDDEATVAEATDAEQPTTEKVTTEVSAAATSLEAPTGQPATDEPAADTSAAESTIEQTGSEAAAADTAAAAQVRSSEEESRPKVGVTYEPDESVEGFPLEYGDIIIGLPKQPGTSTDADAEVTANSTPEAGADTAEAEAEADSAVAEAAADSTAAQADDDRTEAQADDDRTETEAEADSAVAEAGADQPAEPVSEPTPEAAAEIPAESTTEASDEPETAEAPAVSVDTAAKPSEDAVAADGSTAGQAVDAEAADESTADQAAHAETANESAEVHAADAEVAGEPAAEQAADAEAAGDADGVDAAEPNEPAEDGETAVQEAESDTPQPDAGVDSDSGSDSDADAGSEASADDQPAGTSDAVSEGAEDAESESAASDDAATTAEVEAEGATGTEADDADDAAAAGTTAIASFAAASSTTDDDADSSSKSDAEGNSSGESGTSTDNAGSADADDNAGSADADDGAGADSADADAEAGSAGSDENAGSANADAGSADADSNSADADSDASVEPVREKSVEEVASEQAAMALITALMKLRGALAGSRLPIDVVGADEARQQQKSMLDQLDDYILPRLVQLEAPVLAVVGGSTGAGKSTLVNSLIGQVVSEPGVLRPTTRSPVLIHHPADAEWFTGDRVLPGMARSSGDRPGGMEDPGQIRLVAADTIPQGLAILDAPDIDSVVEANRDLATQLLAAADLWLFVTTAARYADAVPWEFLQSASDRSTAVAVVLDRAPADTIDDITGHLAQMLLERGLGDSPLFSIKETVVDSNGMLASDVVASIKDWLIDLAADAEARSAVVRRTLQGAVTAMTKKTPAFAKAVRAQADTIVELRSTAETAYERAVKDIAKATQDGTMLRGEVLARWQEFVGTGELLKGLQTNVGRLRDKVRTAVVGKPPPTRDLNDAVESGLESLLREHAEAAAERAEESWQSTAPGRQLLAAGDRDMGRMSKEFPAEAGRAVREWQGYVLELVRQEGAEKRSTARILAYGVNGLGLALMVVIFASTAGIPTGAEVGVGAGTAVVGQKLLEAVFGDQAVRSLAAKARDDLDARVHALMDAEFARYLAVLDQHPVDPDAPRQLTEAARAVEDCT